MTKITCVVCGKQMGMLELTICDNCGAEYCIDHVVNNKCPLCGEKHSEYCEG